MLKTLLTATALLATVTFTHANDTDRYAGLPGVRSYGDVVNDAKRKERDKPRVNTTYSEITSFDTVNSCYHGLTRYC